MEVKSRNALHLWEYVVTVDGLQVCYRTSAIEGPTSRPSDAMSPDLDRRLCRCVRIVDEAALEGEDDRWTSDRAGRTTLGEATTGLQELHWTVLGKP